MESNSSENVATETIIAEMSEEKVKNTQKYSLYT